MRAVRDRLRRWRERAWIGVAWRLPRPLVMWAAVRLGAEATTGEYSGTITPELTMIDALKRWR